MSTTFTLKLREADVDPLERLDRLDAAAQAALADIALEAIRAALEAEESHDDGEAPEYVGRPRPLWHPHNARPGGWRGGSGRPR